VAVLGESLWVHKVTHVKESGRGLAS